MNQKTLAAWLKIVLVGIGVCGLVVYLLIIPDYGKSLVSLYPEFSNRYLPWLIFLWISGIPFYVILCFGWKIASNIGGNKSFIFANAKFLKRISWLAAGDSIFFFVGNVALFLLNMSHPGIALFSLFVVFVGIVVTVITATLSHFVLKAAALQEQNDLTI